MQNINYSIFLSPPDVNHLEEEAISNAIKSKWIAPVGPSINSFESEFNKYIEIKHSCAVSSGTAALHLALKVLNISKGDVVLCPSFTFVASANVILYENATPIFIDSEYKTGTIDISALEKAIIRYKPKALIAVNIYGQSCYYDKIIKLCKSNNIFIIEDAAESLGSVYKNKKCGSIGDIGIFSFNGNKIITTSGGGMIVSNKKEYIEKARFLSTQSREKKNHYEHNELGYNYRMSNLLAAIGVSQLKKVDNFIMKRRKIFNIYKQELCALGGFDYFEELPNSYSNRWLSVFIIDERVNGITSSKIIKKLYENKIESRPLWKPMHLQKLYKGCAYVKSGNKDISSDLFERGLCLPSGSSLKEKQQQEIIRIIKDMVE